MGLLKTLIDSNERELNRLAKEAEAISVLEPQVHALSDEQLRAKTDDFKARLAAGESVDDLLPEAFAVVREASVRAIGLRHFDVQLMGGIVLHEGRIAEMKTGEGKTLVAPLALYLNALSGRGAHLVTVNDYLARFHAEWMGKIYEFLGMRVGVVLHGMTNAEKRDAYYCDITYGTNSEIGFDYLRDNMAHSPEDLMQRELHYAIVDEVDSILIDEARTPLIISGTGDKGTELHYVVDKVVKGLASEKDYTVDEKAHAAMLTEEGTTKVEKAMGIDNLADADNLQIAHLVNAALKAHSLFKKDVRYVVKDNEVVIVDEFTGRLQYGRRYSDGIHQALEAKEGLVVEEENQTLATITYQNFFRMYKKLAGMTGTAKTEEEEFRKIYGLDVVVVPTNEPMIRTDYPDVIFKTEEAKFRGLTSEILRLSVRGQPILVGTRSIEVSERLSDRLSPIKLQLLAQCMLLIRDLREAKGLEKDKREAWRQILFGRIDDLSPNSLRPIARAFERDANALAAQNVRAFGELLGVDPAYDSKLTEVLDYGVEHNVLNAKYHEQEAQIIAEAGREYAVTVATNMAGRGVDIILGGSIPQGEEEDSEHKEAYRRVKAAGGLAVLGSERHESRRIDNQLRGRSGRQGDPGMSRFYISLEDELWRLFGERGKSFLLSGWEEDQPLDAKILSRLIERAQKRVEGHNFDIRKNVLKYDDVMNEQREVIYRERRKVLEGADLRANMLEFLTATIEHHVKHYCPAEVNSREWDTDTLYMVSNSIFPLQFYASPEDLAARAKSQEAASSMLIELAEKAYADREEQIGPEVLRQIERYALLMTVDRNWIDHLEAMDYLRDGISLRAYAQQDPIIPYTNEAYDMFQAMLMQIREQTIQYIFRARVAQKPARSMYRVLAQSSGGDGEGTSPAPQRAARQATVTVQGKVGRNDPCPCGSGKKYKKCCLPKLEGR
jgi:preprotein translocase subunit SecA